MFLEVPPRVEYELSPTGRELFRRVRPLSAWIVAELAAFKVARQRFDARLTK
jgi:DNA-binding HxlR family transcriptional regulator